MKIELWSFYSEFAEVKDFKSLWNIFLISKGYFKILDNSFFFFFFSPVKQYICSLTINMLTSLAAQTLD